MLNHFNFFYFVMGRIANSSVNVFKNQLFVISHVKSTEEDVNFCFKESYILISNAYTLHIYTRKISFIS